MKTPFFSVVIDNHNYGRFLKAAIDSVLAQDFPKDNFELVVVDDGSTDDSREILAGYGNRIRAVLQERQGQATAFNRGFKESRGEVVCLLDSDDVWLPGKLSKVAPLFKDPSVGCVQHILQDVDVSLKPLRDSFPYWPARYTLEDFLEARTHFTATTALCFRKNILEKALPIPKDLFYYLDDFLTVRSLFYSQIANISEILGFHRVHGGNWCAGGYEDPRKIEVDFKNRKIFSAYLEKWLSEAGRKFSPEYLGKERLELFKRRVLYEALRARPVEAWNAWLAGFKELGGSSFGKFRLASVLLAVISPSLYLAAYSGYAKASSLKNLRLRLFPD